MRVLRYRPPTRPTILVTLAFAGLVSLLLALSKPVELRVDGQRVLSDVPPVTNMVGEKVFVPLRPVGEALGAQTSYDEKTGQIRVTRGEQTLALLVGSAHARLNGMPMTLGHAPFPVRGRVMVGLKSLAAAFGLHVRYDKRTQRVDVETPGVLEAGAQPDGEAPAP